MILCYLQAMERNRRVHNVPPIGVNVSICHARSEIHSRDLVALSNPVEVAVRVTMKVIKAWHLQVLWQLLGTDYFQPLHKQRHRH